MPQHVSTELYRRYKDVILGLTNARQSYRAGKVDRGLSDAEIAERLEITPEEAREIRCIAELDLVDGERWLEADAWKEERRSRMQGEK